MKTYNFSNNTQKSIKDKAYKTFLHDINSQRDVMDMLNVRTHLMNSAVNVKMTSSRVTALVMENALLLTDA